MIEVVFFTYLWVRASVARVVRDETGEGDALRTWYTLFVETQKRHGLPPFPPTFFQSMFEELTPDSDARLFVVPSTSPANAAVPWDERLRWFVDLANRASG